MRAIWSPAAPPGGVERPGAVFLALPRLGAGRAVVAGHRLHLKRDALLPVGRDDRRLVPLTREPAEAVGPYGPALADGRGVVFDPTGSRVPPSRRRPDPRNLRANWPRGVLLGSSSRHVPCLLNLPG